MKNMNITALSDDELRAQVLAFGINAGPVLKSTRRVYQIKLEKLLSEVHIDAKTKKISPEKLVQQEPSVKPKKAEKTLSKTVSEIPDSSYDYEYEASSVTEIPESSYDYDDEPSLSPEVEIPQPKPVITLSNKSTISHSLPDYKRPPLKSTWENTDYGTSKSNLTHRKNGQGVKDNLDGKLTEQTKGKEKKAAESGGSKLSVFLQIVVFLIICLIIFLIFTNMEPDGKNPFQGITNQ